MGNIKTSLIVWRMNLPANCERLTLNSIGTGSCEPVESQMLPDNAPKWMKVVVDVAYDIDDLFEEMARLVNEYPIRSAVLTITSAIEVALVVGS